MSKMASEETSKRNLLGRQPARSILIDISSPFDHHVCGTLCDSLENLFAVACGLAGPSRIPMVSIFLLTAQPELLLPLSSLKGNLSRIQNALRTIKTSVSEVGNCLPRHISCIPQAVHQATEQFRRQVCTFTQPGLSMNQLEVIILGCRSGEFVSRQIEAVSDTVHIQHLKRIVCVTLTPQLCGSEDGLLDISSQGSGVSSTSVITGLVDTLTLDADCVSLQNFFHGWLTDCGSDSEHLHIVLPSKYTDGSRLVLKCDLHEGILNPAQLPYNTAYTLHPESATCKLVFASTSKAAGITVPVHSIYITALIHTAAVCESVIFGLPLMVQPTSCWKVDWDDLEKNQQNFKALCHLLHKKDMVMLGQMEHPVQPVKASSHPPPPCGWFILLPGPNISLLLKSVAVSELLLPAGPGQGGEELSEDSVDLLAGVLDQIDVLETFNPLGLTSGLFDSLKCQTKGNRSMSQAKKREIEKETFTSGCSGPPVNKVRGVITATPFPQVPSAIYTAHSTQQQQQKQHRQHRTKKPLTSFLTELE
ncbi:meiosis 1 arrest protein-like isoform X1 [Haliotis rufescens]|uniref:meiosis 1 arrest protein-like isoform X1 n=1 Tax=Haliotis rufescens TaxID=6454 RepID=UPI00201F0770|nr:meiosis 1 arrest protein-like isoform X1 [Haliotis rufescens]